MEYIPVKQGRAAGETGERITGNYSIESFLKGYPRVVTPNIGAQEGKLAKIGTD
ncbi:MAG: hypothetical protein JJE25_09320 [Bacteroidia bacterium]|nr:hypothetical protein [Bacteroidia bacterium]